MSTSFWSSVDLTGNQTVGVGRGLVDLFWSSVDLTGNQTRIKANRLVDKFWSSVDLAGNQTIVSLWVNDPSFGAVSN